MGWSELEFDEYSNKPIRVRSIGFGPLLEWNVANPGKPIRVGDRILKVSDARGHEASDKESILELIHHAHQWTKFELKVTFMRKVNAHQQGLNDDLLPNAEETKRILASEAEALEE